MVDLTAVSMPRQTGDASPREPALMEAARALEANFLSEMLKAAGFGATSSAFGGGVGEDQFASFLRDAQAREMAEAGGIGIAQSLYEAMVERQHDRHD